MKNILKKKFSVRIKHYSEKYYTIQYCEYRLFKVYNNLDYYICYSYLSDLEHWGAKLFTYEDAEKLAKTFNCLQDIVKWQNPYKEKEIEFLKKKEEFIKNNIPYAFKLIK